MLDLVVLRETVMQAKNLVKVTFSFALRLIMIAASALRNSINLHPFSSQGKALIKI